MSFETQETDTSENYEKYFCHFSHQLFDNPLEPQDDFSKDYSESQEISDNSSTHYSNNSVKEISDDEEKYIPLNLLNTTPSKNNTENTEDNSVSQKAKTIKPELQKFQLPKSLFNVKKSSQESISKQLNLKSEPFVPKKKLLNEFVETDTYILCNINQKTTFKNDYSKNQSNKRKKRKNKEFVEREGDWSCYRCKNLNFKFRSKCNKCGLNKEESEKKFVEVGEQLLKLADLTIYEKK